MADGHASYQRATSKDGEAATLQRDSDRYLLREGRSTASTPEETTI